MEEQQNPYLHGRKVEELLRLPCSACGGQLAYSAERQLMFCRRCGHVEDFAKDNDKIVEMNLTNFLNKSPRLAPEALQKKVVECQSCRAQLMIDPKDVAVRCNFCGSNKVNEKAFDKNLLQPQGLIPFKVGKAQAMDLFKTWIKRGWFRPNKLKTLAALGDVHGIYVPFWTFDAQTRTHWQGEAGYHYYETELVMENGKQVEKQVQKTRWEWRQGRFSRFFDDVLVVASKGLPEAVIRKIYPYGLKELINFSSPLLVGWEAEIYSVEVKEGYDKADKEMNDALRAEASRLLGGDTQRHLSLDIKKSDQTFKHILLPVWLCTYQYNNKTYRFAVNGQTAKIDGEKPVSWVKIFFLVVFIIGFIVVMMALTEGGE